MTRRLRKKQAMMLDWDRIEEQMSPAGSGGRLTVEDREELAAIVGTGTTYETRIVAAVERIVAASVAAAETRGYAKCWNDWVHIDSAAVAASMCDQCGCSLYKCRQKFEGECCDACEHGRVV